jgi:hypothetical protein
VYSNGLSNNSEFRSAGDAAIDSSFHATFTQTVGTILGQHSSENANSIIGWAQETEKARDAGSHSRVGNFTPPVAATARPPCAPISGSVQSARTNQLIGERTNIKGDRNNAVDMKLKRSCYKANGGTFRCTGDTSGAANETPFAPPTSLHPASTGSTTTQTSTAKKNKSYLAPTLKHPPRVGAIVSIDGMGFTKELNGLRGRVINVSPDPDYMGVELFEHGIKALHTKYLQEVEPPPSELKHQVPGKSAGPVIAPAGTDAYWASCQPPTRSLEQEQQAPGNPAAPFMASAENAAWWASIKQPTWSVEQEDHARANSAGPFMAPTENAAYGASSMPSTWSTDPMPQPPANSAGFFKAPAEAASSFSQGNSATPFPLSAEFPAFCSSGQEDFDRTDSEMRISENLLLAMEKGEVIARDEDGTPTISRQVDEKTGVAKTVVITDEGKKQAYGESTIRSLLDSPDQKAQDWIKGLTTHQMRGLIHEVGRRLIENSQVYHLRLKELKRLREQQGFLYFGLSKDATEKELEAAYRILAKKMHPDKNGGTDEAKKAFQTMRERYESLRKRVRKRAQGLESDGDTDSDESKRGKGSKTSAEGCAGQILDGEPPPEDAEQRRNQQRQKEAYDEDDDDEDKGKNKKEERQSSSINYDPSDRESMRTCMLDMLKSLKKIRPQQEQLAKELYQTSSDLRSESKAHENDLGRAVV